MIYASRDAITYVYHQRSSPIQAAVPVYCVASGCCAVFVRREFQIECCQETTRQTKQWIDPSSESTLRANKVERPCGEKEAERQSVDIS
jgi:hypothetical protein